MANYLELLEKERKKLGKLDKSALTQQIVYPKAKPSGGYVSSPTSNSLPRTKKKDEDEEEDIAPVKESKLDFFQKSSVFDDGWDMWDVTKTILGTAGDAGLNLVKGVAGIGEGVADLLVYGAAGVGDLLGKDEWADETRKRAQKSVVDDLTKDADTYLDKYSVLGRTTDNILQGVGQVGGIMATGGAGAAAGLSAGGVTALTTATMGLSGMGSGMGEAYQGGATDGEALAYGAISGAADALTEMMFGGLGKAINAVGFSKGLSSADDIFAKKVSKLFKDQIAKNVAEFGIKAGAEGFEEFVAGTAQALGKKLTYMSEEDLGKILEDENLLEQVVVGSVTGGLIQSGIVPGTYKGSLIETTRAGKDFITGYSQNEQAVIKKEVENRISEREKNGKKLTLKEKSAIEARVEEDMEKGYISIDTIESTLGNDPEYDSLLKDSEEFKTLYETTDNLSEKQRDRLAELKKRNEETPFETALKTAQKKRSDSVFELVKDSRLAESYREKDRIYEDFVPDESKFKGAKHQDAVKTTLDNAVKSGANNTNRVRDFVELVAKISGDTGLTFDFKSGEQTKDDFIERQTQQIANLEKLGALTTEQSQELAQLKDTLEKVQSGKLTVDGDISGNGIVLNLDTGKPLNRVTGHEVTHSLEQAKAYEDLRKAVISYAKTKGIDVDSEITARKAKYQGITNANPEAEFVADMVGDYLFNDADFINNLSVNHKNVFQKIYDEIKYLYKQATAGSKEARELERVKHLFEKAYQESSNTAAKKYSISETTDGRFAAVVDNDILSNIDTSSWDNTKKAEAKRAASDALKQFSDGIVVDGITRNVNRVSRKEYTRSKYTESLYKHSPDVFADKMRAAEVADDIVVAATNWQRDGGLKHPRTDNFVDFDHGKTLIVSGNSKYIAEVVVGITNDGESVLYDVVDITPTTFDIKKAESSTTATTQDAIGSIHEDSAAPNISQEDPVVNRQFSLSDTSGRQLSNEQQEYFKDSVVRDENGSLKVMYHGTSKGGFNVFDTYGSNYGLFGTGSYFTDSKTIAESYTKKGKGKNPQVYESYLNIKNPVDMDAAADPAQWAKAFPDADFPESGTNEQFYRAVEEFYADQWMPKWEVAEEIQSGIESNMGYDGITHIGGGRVNPDGERHRVYIAFQPEQIKNTDNAKPTENADIRYSLSDSQGRELSKEQQQYFKGSKVVDENGKLKAVYHGSPSEFNTFSLDYLGTNGTAEGYGFYFTDKKSIAENYTKGLEGQRQQEKTGKLFEVYLDIKKPLSDKKVTMSRAQFKKFLLELNKQVDADGEPLDILSNYGDVDWEGLNKVINYAMEIEYDGSDNDVNLVSSIINGSGNLKTVLDVLRKTTGYDGIIVNEASWGGDQTIYLAFHPEQIKNVDNINPTNDPDIRRSLSSNGEAPVNPTSFDIYGKDFSVQRKAQDVAPVAETVSKTESVAPVAENATTAENLFPDNVTPLHEELEYLQAELEDITGALDAMSAVGDFNAVDNLMHELGEVQNRITELQQTEDERVSTLDDADAPPEMDAPYQEASNETVDNPFDERDWYKVGNQKVKAYMYENPEVKPFFQEEALALMSEWRDTTRGQRYYSEEAFIAHGNEAAWTGVSRHTSKSMEELLDSWHMSYDDIEKGLNAIIEDNGAENIAAAKKIEFMLNDRLMHGYKDFYSNKQVPPNQDYINLLKEKQINEYSKEAFDSLMQNADDYAPLAQEEAIKPVAQSVAPARPVAQDIAPVDEKYEAIRPQQKKQPKMVRVDNSTEKKTAEILVDEPKVQKKKSGLWSMFKENVLDNGMVFEDLSLKHKNRELQAKWNYTRYAQGNAQHLIGNGAEGVRSLDSIVKEVEKTGKVKEFYEYLHHWLNVDRMTLENRYNDTPNKAVFGDHITADMSRAAAVELGRENPEFKQLAQDIYAYNNHLRKLLVDGGVISQETADLWAEMYPHYVPIRRVGHEGLDINVPLDTRKTGVNAPVKKATGGNADILPLFDTMAQRTMQTYRAIARNRFGVELKNTLGTTIANEQTSVDEVDSSIDNQDGLLKEGKNGSAPTFTVFENGEKVTFEITEEMYDALKPAGKGLTSTSKILNTASNLHRGVLTEYNPVFLASNAIKDAQEIIINSQHAAKTYARLPQAYYELTKKGKWYKEYMENGGEQNTYFDNESNTFDTKEKGARKLLGIPPLSWISKANNFVERAPRLAEYIASRKSGRSVEVSMLDAARVTTNFAAGGRLTKFANRNGATFLNASVQGAVQQVRNLREAKANGLKGVLGLVGRYAMAGLPAVLLNKLMWEDDEEYEELSDYVKQNYYVVAKFGDGKFVRIPKGRTVAVIQNAMEQISNVLNGEEADWGGLGELAISNLAPNNPLENNIIAPIIQQAANKTWYGEDLVPTRLQDLPAAEQYDESTDAISKWLGEKLNYSPIKINYLLDQYTGGIGDTVLPMLTPEAESGDNTILGNALAPWKSKFTTDSVMNNQNVSDFYDTVDELTTNAKSSMATDEDILKYKYMNSVNSELSKLYAQKRKVQNSILPDSLKYERVRAIQQQIVDIAKEGLGNYEDITFENDYRGGGEYARVNDRVYKLNDDGEWQKLSDEQLTKYEVTKAAGDSSYATDGKNHYRWYVPGEDAAKDAKAEWRKITEKELERQKEVTSGLGISPEEYWNDQEEHSYAYEHPESYAVAKAVGGYEKYQAYSSELYDIKADKDSSGKSISGSRKDKVFDYINNLDIDYGMKIILFKNEYNADDTYNYDIIDYLNNRDDISYSEMVTILKKLGFTVDSEGNVSW